MSGTDLIRGYGPLEDFFGAEEGVSLKADNGRFLSDFNRGNIFGIEAAKQPKDEWCKYLVEKLVNGKVRFKDCRGVFLSRITRGGKEKIEASKVEPDICCEFTVYTGNGRVVFQADNGLFLSRVEYNGPVHSLEAAKIEADESCQFVPKIGDVIMPAFEIVSIEINSGSLVKKRLTMKEKEYINTTSLEQKINFNLTWEEKVTEVTKWKNAWGLNTAISATTHCVDTHFGVTVSYDGMHGKISSKEKIISEVEGVTLTILPQKRTTVKLMVTMVENADIPFTATIKKIKANGEVQMLTETGIWKGVAYSDVGVEIGEHCLEECEN